MYTNADPELPTPIAVANGIPSPLTTRLSRRSFHLPLRPAPPVAAPTSQLRHPVLRAQIYDATRNGITTLVPFNTVPEAPAENLEASVMMGGASVAPVDLAMRERPVMSLREGLAGVGPDGTGADAGRAALGIRVPKATAKLP
ncbi:hypothetical protein B0H14DRAFT_2562137 [Mycena olivaceomarginata]|nr:hypothetical protein B0H14DRAFT_2562137 [Mycena olivaceomarginata]